MNSEKFQAPEMLLDSDGYFKSFDVDTCSLHEITEHYNKYGLIVFRNVLNHEQVQLSISDLWQDTTNYFSHDPNRIVKRDDPATWKYITSWQKAFGFVNSSVIMQTQFWKNRNNPKVYHCFKKTYEAQSQKKLSEPMLCCFDRGSMMLPSGINKDWETDQIYHFDIDPWLWVGMSSKKHPDTIYDENFLWSLLGEGNYTPNVGYTKLAGVLALSDTDEESGGFQCAPGFQNYIKQWCENNPNYTHITEDKNLVDNFRKIFMRKGSLLVFSRELPHNIYKNKSKNFRYAQYLRMTPESALSLSEEQKKNRKRLIRKILPHELNVSDPISKEIFMLAQDGQEGSDESEGIKKQKKGQKVEPVKEQKKEQKKRCQLM